MGELEAPAGSPRRGRNRLRHLKELAPTTELRQLQYREDDRLGEGKRSRTRLAPEYTRRYTGEILDFADLSPIVEVIDEGRRPALLCVERDPEACHRSLIAERLAGAGARGQAPAPGIAPAAGDHAAFADQSAG